MTQAHRRRSAPRITAALLGAMVLSACLQNQTVSQSGVVSGNGLAPPGAPPGTCWAKIPTPAVIETVTEQILVTPAKMNPDGTLASLPVYREESRQQIVTPRTDRGTNRSRAAQRCALYRNRAGIGHCGGAAHALTPEG